MFERLAGYGVISLLLKWFAMDFLQEYEGSDSEATDVYNSTNIDVKPSDKGASTSVLNVRAVRQVYLITYSQVDYTSSLTEIHLCKLFSALLTVVTQTLNTGFVVTKCTNPRGDTTIIWE